ncbi:MAG: hypothetical protein SGILL_005712 [Bacillariaceae sp.]
MTRRVRFSETMRVRLSACRKDYTPKDVQNCWYSREEAKNMRTERNFVALALFQEKLQPGSQQRQLEKFKIGEDDMLYCTGRRDAVDIAAMQSRKENILKIRSLVSRLHGVRCDPQKLAKAYGGSCESYVNEARVDALSEAREALQIAFDDLDDMLKVLAPSTKTESYISSLKPNKSCLSNKPRDEDELQPIFTKRPCHSQQEEEVKRPRRVSFLL